MYNNKDDITEQIHTMCLTKDDTTGKYILHNDYTDGSEKNDMDNYVGYTYYDSVEDAINYYNSGNAKLITIIGVY